MQIETVEISSITPDPANVRTHSQRNIEAIAASLRRFGQQKPIVLDANGVVRAGNGTFAAAKLLGWTHIDAVRTALTGVELVAYGIADNRTGDADAGSEWDRDALALTLSAINTEVPGFSLDEIASLIAQAGSTAALPPDAAGTVVDETVADHIKFVKCPFCQKEFPQ